MKRNLANAMGPNTRFQVLERATGRLSRLMRLLLLCLAGFATLPASAAPVPSAQSVSQEAQRIFRDSHDAVLQIRTVVAGSDNPESVGSGFVVSADGLVITSYHVIASWVGGPDQYRLEYATHDKEVGPLQVLAVDVRHDLALLSRGGRNLSRLAMAPAPLAIGETAYALGNPKDMGLTLIEGTYNGLRDHTLYDEIHFTGAINSGMSGGPALNGVGQVFGISMARVVDDQLIGILVPVRYARELLARKPDATPTTEQIMAEVRQQVLDHGRHLLETIGALPLPTIETHGYRLPLGFSGNVRCSGSASRDNGFLFRTKSRACSLYSRINPIDRMELGGFKLSYLIYEKGELDALRFAKARSWGARALAPAEQFPYAHLTRYQCRTSLVTTNGTPLKTMLCLRGYKRLPGIQDVVLQVSSQTGADAEINALLVLDGVPFEPAMAFVRRFLEAIRWNG